MHVLLYDPKMSGSKETKPYPCELCNLSFSTARGVATHKGMIHRCHFTDSHNRRCEELNCQEHFQDYIFLNC